MIFFILVRTKPGTAIKDIIEGLQDTPGAVSIDVLFGAYDALIKVDGELDAALDALTPKEIVTERRVLTSTGMSFHRTKEE